MRRTLVLALLAALLLAPHAGAWPWDPLTITVAESRVGDVMRYGYRSISPDGERHQTELVAIEGEGTVSDRFGHERLVETHRVETRDGNGTLVSAVRCHALPGGNATVRRDVLAGTQIGRGSWSARSTVATVSLGDMSGQHEMQVETDFLDFRCEGRNTLGGRTLREGERVPLSLLGFGFEDEATSAPAEPTSFHGRHALLFRFEPPLPPEAPPGARYRIDVVLADGLPGIGRMELRAEADGEAFAVVMELEGIINGEGPRLAPFVGATLPRENPDARFVRISRFQLPDDGMELPYRSREAIASLLADPRVGLREWLDAHPDAVLDSATYTRDHQGRLGAKSDGEWTFTFVTGSEMFQAASARVYHETPLGRVARPPVWEQWGARGSHSSSTPGTPLPAESSADGATLLALAAVHGFPVDRMRQVSFSLTGPGGEPGHLIVEVADNATQPEREGQHHARGVWLSASSGSALVVWRSTSLTTTTSLLDPLAPPRAFVEPSTLFSLSALAGPGVGVGLGVGAATGLALLVVAVKFLLVPLFTRLVRAQLLDNPVRARLYERVRAEPGIRQSELVDFLGVGEGATRHHLAQLVRHRFVVECRDDGAPSYYAAGEVPPEVARRAAVLRSASAQRVYDAYAAAPGLSLREAAARLGMSAPSVHRQKRKLEKAGLLPVAPTLRA